MFEANFRVNHSKNFHASRATTSKRFQGFADNMLCDLNFLRRSVSHDRCSQRCSYPGPTASDADSDDLGYDRGTASRCQSRCSGSLLCMKYCCEHGVRTADRGRQQRKEGRRDIPKTTPTRQMFHPLSDAWPHVILLIRQSR